MTYFSIHQIYNNCYSLARVWAACARMYSYVTRMYLYVTRMYSCGVLVTIPLCVVLSPLDDSMLHYTNKQNIRITGTTCTLLLTRVPIGCIKNTLTVSQLAELKI